MKEFQACARHRWPREEDGSCGWCVGERAETRALLVRALTAQGWMVACALDGTLCASPDDDWDQPVVLAMSEVAALPSPADLADEVMGHVGSGT